MGESPIRSSTRRGASPTCSATTACMAYTEQITFLLFLKMAHEQTLSPWNRDSIVPDGLDWPSLLALYGEGLETHYRHILAELPKQGGVPGEIFKKSGATALTGIPRTTW